MTTAFEHFVALDRLVHEPARLALLTVLDACRQADFRLLMSATGLPAGNVSSHLAKLEAAGLIEIVKTFRSKRPHTDVCLLPAGAAALQHYWTCVDDARRAGEAWRTSMERPAHAS
jgi:DNA-binding transcriptional ArsR family regulator